MTCTHRLTWRVAPAELLRSYVPMQALIYFAVSKKGELPIDGKTDANPEGLTAVTGKHAHAFAARLAAGDLSCKVLDQAQYKKSMLEKLIWICAVMLVGTKNGNVTVGEVEEDHKDEVDRLFSACCTSFRHAMSSALFHKTIHVPN
ncbi:TPA: hypothetical protein ACH3X1_013477 [Trebouxia sp. C0004]